MTDPEPAGPFHPWFPALTWREWLAVAWGLPFLGTMVLTVVFTLMTMTMAPDWSLVGADLAQQAQVVFGLVFLYTIGANTAAVLAILAVRALRKSI